MRKFFAGLFSILLYTNAHAQSFHQLKVGNSTPIDPSATLEVQSTTGAILFPRMTSTQRTAITPTNGDVVYDSTLNQFYAYQNGSWIQIATGAGAIWGQITGTLSSQTDLQSALNLKAPLASPTFTGTVTTPLSTAGPVLTSSGGVLSSSATLSSTYGGLGINASSSTGYPSASSGTFSIVSASTLINAIVPSQTGNSGKFLTTNGSAVSWGSGGGTTWGSITGTLSSQTDLQTALNAKLTASNNLSDVSSATTAFNNIVPTMTNGQLIVGKTSNSPVVTTLTAGSGVTITNGPGTITIASSGGGSPSYIRMDGMTSFGSTNTTVAIFNAHAGSGSDITYATSATAGDSITINTAGVYTVSFTGALAAGPASFGASVNASGGNLTAAIYLVTAANVLIQATSAGIGYSLSGSYTGHFNVNDVIRPQGDGTVAYSGNNAAMIFTVSGPL